MVLSPEKEFNFNDEFELDFDMALHRSEKSIYGYVFRIILNGELNIDLVHGFRNDSTRDFSIIVGSRKSEIAFNFVPPLEINKWIKFKIKFIMNEDKIIFYNGDLVFVDSTFNLQNHSRASISFGACTKEDFISTDVPPILIKDVKIRGKKGKLLNHWPLNQTEGNYTYDILNNRKAIITNPDWLLTANLNWNRISETSFKGNALLVQDQAGEKIYILGEEFMIIYDAGLNQFDTLSYLTKPEFFTRDGQAVYDQQSQRIISYNIDSRQLFYIDPLSGEIIQEKLIPHVRIDFSQHNKYYDEADSLLYIYNGYGHYHYKNVMWRCKIGSNIWEEIRVKGERPHARYLAASGFLDDTLYFLGGYGSESGKQMLNPHHYYDLNAYSLKDNRFIKKDSFPKPDDNFCFANSMVIDPQTRNFYVLSFPEFKYQSHLQLLRGSLDGGPLERMGDHIPYLFNDINSFADLYYFPVAKKMFAATLLTEDEHGSRIVLHSIGFPPIAEQVVPEQNPKKKGSLLFLFILASSFVIIMVIWLFLSSRKKKQNGRNGIPEKTDVHEPVLVQASSNQSNAINFFGGFQVIDRTEADITNKFTPLLKELFLIIILHSIKNDKGISSSRIIEFLWFDKSERSARNNLSVNITKLKNILSKLDGCELTHETGYWKIHLGKEIHNEYCEVEAIVNSKDKINQQRISRLIEITNRGPFLINLGFEWLDVFKARISDRISDVLLSFAETLNVKKNAELIIDLADCLFNFDIVNEEIMILKCRAQYGQGKHSLAKNTYQNFCNEYKTLYGEDFKQSFNEIIKDQS